MIGFNRLFGLPPRFITPILVFVGGGAIFWRWLTSSIWGVLFLALVAYWYLTLTSDSQPLSGVELLGWYLSLDTDAQAAIAAVVLTVLSFFIAFGTAHTNWVQQKRIELDLAIRNEIEVFFNEASVLLIKTGLFAEQLIEFVDRLSESGDDEETQFKARMLQRNVEKFVSARTRLSEMSLEVNRIRGKNVNALSAHWGLLDSLDSAMKLFDELTTRMWFPAPFADLDDPNIVATIARQIDLARVQAFVEIQDTYALDMNVLTAKVGSQLMTQVNRVNISGLSFLIRSSKMVESARTAFTREH